uniref:Putative thymidylate synthase n=1 Tax=viral metagenome TaxID=1070528 RepID=A0A6H1ZGD7_9ZZZZ
MQIISDNFNDLFKKSAFHLKLDGQLVNPRGLPCRETICPQLILTDPSKCLITLKERKLNYAYAIIEKLMYASFKSDPEVICYYNPNMKRFINKETDQFDGAYGLRIKQGDQLFWCYEKLKEDPDTRQAVITIHDHQDCRETLDPACTLSLQFLIRDNKLHMICGMRSNDLLFGTCLDIQAFCFLQEVMACWLEVEIGSYIHQPASLHYYLDVEEKVLTTAESSELNEESLPEWDVSKEDHLKCMNAFWDCEKALRESKEVNWELLSGSKALTTYLQRIKSFIQKRHERKVKESL